MCEVLQRRHLQQGRLLRAPARHLLQGADRIPSALLTQHTPQKTSTRCLAQALTLWNMQGTHENMRTLVILSSTHLGLHCRRRDALHCIPKVPHSRASPGADCLAQAGAFAMQESRVMRVPR